MAICQVIVGSKAEEQGGYPVPETSGPAGRTINVGKLRPAYPPSAATGE